MTVTDRTTEERCTGCGMAIADAELAEMKRRDKRISSCCPERKMVAHCVVCGEPVMADDKCGCDFFLTGNRF